MIKSYPKDCWKDKPEIIPVDKYRKMKIKPEKTLRELKSELDKVFNAYIRKRDTLPNNLFQCISCQGFKPLKQMNAGHFYSAGGHESLRWNEFNVNGQCIHCNLYKHANQIGYAAGLRQKFGKKVLEDLELSCHNKSKMMKFEVQLLIDKYKQLLK